jgi:hypothetical protein
MQTSVLAFEARSLHVAWSRLGTGATLPSKRKGMLKLILASAIVVTLAGTAADAASGRKHRKPVYRSAPMSQTYQVPQRSGPIGPAWAGPNQCWTDEGYGRYAPCDGGGKAM